MQHLIPGRNVALMFNRQIAGAGVTQFGVTSLPACHGTFYLGNRGQDYVAPLYLVGGSGGTQGRDGDASSQVRSNIDGAILTEVAARLNLRVDERGAGLTGVLCSRDVLDYVYSVLNSARYRDLYSSYLRLDFPRVPLPSDPDLFRELCRHGSRLVTLHLMEAPDLAPGAPYQGKGDNYVGTVRYSEPGQGAEQGRVWINATQYFDGVPPNVWEFHLGGYQVCAKWLKDRKGRLLTYDDLAHYQYIVAALAETITIMREIDDTIDAHGGWPLK